MKDFELSQLCIKLEEKKREFRAYQCYQESVKRDYNIWDPYDGLSKEEHEHKYTCIINDNRYLLRKIQDEIKELIKEIKKKQRSNGKLSSNILGTDKKE